MTNAVFMPYVLAFNRDAIEERIARLAAYCGIKGGFDGFAKAVLKLRKELKVPHALPGLIKGLDMDKKRKGLIADMAVVDPTAGGNPVKLTKKAALRCSKTHGGNSEGCAGYARTCWLSPKREGGNERQRIANG